MGYYSNLRKLSEGETINDNESDEDDDNDDDDEDGDDGDDDLEAVIMISHVFDPTDDAASLTHLINITRMMIIMMILHTDDDDDDDDDDNDEEDEAGQVQHGEYG